MESTPEESGSAVEARPSRQGPGREHVAREVPAPVAPTDAAAPTPRSGPSAESPPAPPPASPLPPGKLTLIGVGHVFAVADIIRDAILAIHPDIVFVELDKDRLGALLYRQQTGKMPDTARGGLVHSRLAKFQERVAKSYGADVGEEMLAAALAGRDIGARVALVDPPAGNTVRRVIQELTWRERVRAVGLTAKSGLGRVFRRETATVESEIKRYESDPDAMLEELRVTFPTVHRIVIQERDEVMAKRIRRRLAGARHGVAVLGDGHLVGMIGLLADLSPEVYRLADVRGGRLPRQGGIASGDGNSVSWTTRAPTDGVAKP